MGLSKAKGHAPRVRVLTLNAWGLWLVSKKRVERMAALADYLASAHHLDVVLLQEMWVGEDVEAVVAGARAGGLTHAMHYRSGVFGAGLVTISRWPITDGGFHLYSAAGDALAVHCGDWLAAKGFGWARLATPSGPVDVYNTHTHANYSHETVDHCHDSPIARGGSGGAGPPGRAAAVGPRTTRATQRHHSAAATNGASAVAAGGARSEPDSGGVCEFRAPADRFAAYRVSQMWELASGVASRGGAIGIILGGDLNSKPDSLEIALLRTLNPGLRDAWEATHGSSEDEAGYTCRAPGCSFKSTRQVPERIDYVWSSLTPVSAAVALQRVSRGGGGGGGSAPSERSNDNDGDDDGDPSGPPPLSYSDHFAVVAELELPGGAGAPTAAAAVAGGSLGSAAAAAGGSTTHHAKSPRRGFFGSPATPAAESPAAGAAGAARARALRAAADILDAGVARSRGQRAASMRASAVALVIALTCLLTLASLLADPHGRGGRGPQALLCSGSGSGGGGGAGLAGVRASVCSRGGDTGGGSTGGGSTGGVPPALAAVGYLLLGAGTVAFSGACVMVGLSGVLADGSQAHALGGSAARVRLALGQGAPAHGLWCGRD
ncbi:hypothetical protein FOA52_007043 [Chlamydomonas sp. UWO 241]|nr:hypothetical protein FOA52_007043 [Chlamydomonas sp. UWO 241]